MDTEKQEGQSISGSSKRGFASMAEERQREISSLGGKAAHKSGHAHEFTSEEARVAGAKGGAASHGRRRASKPSQPPSEQGEPVSGASKQSE